MKNIYSLTFASLLLMCVSLKAQLPSNVQARLQTVLDSVCNKYKIKGTSAAVLYPGKGVWSGVNGISHAGAPIERNMLLGMGSNTKTFISALLLKLQENNLLSLDDSIGKWIVNKPNINGQITIRQCLNHTSGLYDYLHNEAINDTVFGKPSKIWTKDELLAVIKTPDFAPGTNWGYSNTNYVIAGIIIEQVTGKTYQQAMRDYILNPAGLSNTFFYDEPGVSVRMPHQWTMSLGGNRMTDLNTFEVDFIPQLFSMATTAGAMVSTADDNVKFWNKLTSGQILSESSYREMTDLVTINGADYGLGIFKYNNALNKRSFYSHGGTFYGFINDNMADVTSGVCISVFTNQDSISNNAILSYVINALHKVTIAMPVGLNEQVYNSSSFKIYPNPASGFVKIDNMDNHTISTVNIYDLTGKRLIETGKIESEVDVQSLVKGMYIIHLLNDKNEIVHIQKLMIEK